MLSYSPLQKPDIGNIDIFGRDSELLAQLVDSLVNQVCRININSQCLLIKEGSL